MDGPNVVITPRNPTQHHAPTLRGRHRMHVSVPVCTGSRSTLYTQRFFLRRRWYRYSYSGGVLRKHHDCELLLLIFNSSNHVHMPHTETWWSTHTGILLEYVLEYTVRTRVPFGSILVYPHININGVVRPRQPATVLLLVAATRGLRRLCGRPPPRLLLRQEQRFWPLQIFHLTSAQDGFAQWR